MKSNKSSLLLLGAALAVVTSPARALVTMANDATLFGTLTASVSYNDNLYLSSPKADTILTEVAPGFLFDYGQSSLFKGRFYYNEAFQWYSDNSNLNTSLSHVGFNGNYNDEKSKLEINASFNQANQATRDIRLVGSLVHRDLINAGIVDEYLATEKSSFSVGVVYADTNYKKVGYTDLQVTSIPVKYYFKAVPKLDVSAGYRYRKNNLGGVGAIDSTQHFFSVGARGEITPKLTGEISVGVEQLKPATGSDNSGFGLDANLTYAYSPKTTLTIGATDGYTYTATGAANRTAGLNVGFVAAIDANWRVNGGLGYTSYSYVGSARDEDFWSAQIGATYIINEKFSLTGTYAYADNRSNAVGASFSDNIVSLAATFKF